jgi:acetyltransferase-like isoleucine patch superfamily enzyme
MKTPLKRLAAVLASVAVFPLFATYKGLSLVAGADRTFYSFSQLMALWPGLTGVYLRRAFYSLSLPECGADAYIGFGTIISHSCTRIGPRTYVGPFCVLGAVTLEPDVLIGSHVSVINGNKQHGIDRLDIPVREQAGEYPHITVGADTWIGDRSVVMANLGTRCVIGAGSIVTKPVDDRAIMVGNPARLISHRGDTTRRAVASPYDEAGYEAALR